MIFVDECKGAAVINKWRGAAVADEWGSADVAVLDERVGAFVAIVDNRGRASVDERGGAALLDERGVDVHPDVLDAHADAETFGEPTRDTRSPEKRHLVIFP